MTEDPVLKALLAAPIRPRRRRRPGPIRRWMEDNIDDMEAAYRRGRGWDYWADPINKAKNIDGAHYPVTELQLARAFYAIQRTMPPQPLPQPSTRPLPDDWGALRNQGRPDLPRGQDRPLEPLKPVNRPPQE